MNKDYPYRTRIVHIVNLLYPELIVRDSKTTDFVAQAINSATELTCFIFMEKKIVYPCWQIRQTLSTAKTIDFTIDQVNQTYSQAG